MPVSFYQAIPTVLHHVLLSNPSSVLDVGVGFGKYGVLIRENMEVPFERYYKEQWIVRVDGVEAYEQYRNPIHDYVYNHVYYGDILNVHSQLQKYDCVLLIDVLEHFTKEEGHQVLETLLQHTNKALIVSTPLYPAHQTEYLGNPFEEHKSRWEKEDFRNYKCEYWIQYILDNGAQFIKLYPNIE